MSKRKNWELFLGGRRLPPWFRQCMYVSVYMFQVRVGNLHYFIGYLQYHSKKSLNPDKVDYFTIIMVTTSIFFLWVVVLWIAITWGCRKVSKAKRRERAGRLIKSVNSSITTSTGMWLSLLTFIFEKNILVFR